MSGDMRRVHLMNGFLPAGRRVRAVCSCGYRTTPHTDEFRAREALATEHGQSQPRCAVCGRDYEGRPWQQILIDLQILTDPIDGEFLACRDAPPNCRDGAAQRQVHLDRAGFEQLGAEPPRPRLRLIRDEP